MVHSGVAAALGGAVLAQLLPALVLQEQVLSSRAAWGWNGVPLCNVPFGSCAEGATVEAGTSCTPQCDYGSPTSNAAIECLATFCSTIGLTCNVETDVWRGTCGVGFDACDGQKEIGAGLCSTTTATTTTTTTTTTFWTYPPTTTQPPTPGPTQPPPPPTTPTTTEEVRARTTPASRRRYPYPYPYPSATNSAWDALCFSGTAQSPIDFDRCSAPVDRAAVAITWADSQNVLLENTGTAIKLTPQGAEPGKMTVGDKVYTLVQCHFHWGSEHFVAGNQYPFEGHCVHSRDDPATGENIYGVFGVFFLVGETSNPFLAAFEDSLPMNPLEARRLAESTGNSAVSAFTGPIDFKQLYNGINLQHFWSYPGSFTTPPCTEAVDFYIMMQPMSITQAQLNKFKAATGWSSANGNFRPPQPLGDRTVEGCAVTETEASGSWSVKSWLGLVAPLLLLSSWA